MKRVWYCQTYQCGNKALADYARLENCPRCFEFHWSVVKPESQATEPEKASSTMSDETNRVDENSIPTSEPITETPSTTEVEHLESLPIEGELIDEPRANTQQVSDEQVADELSSDGATS